jgi:uncharacterized protein YwqG
MTRDEAAEIIRKSELSTHADSIIEKLRPSILIRAKRVPLDELPLGASRMGGVPDLPQRFEWPRWIGSTVDWVPGGSSVRRIKIPEKNLHFIAQLHLEELRSYSVCKDLPSEGMLYFFYDLDVQPWGYGSEDWLGSRVIFTETSDTPLIRTANAAHDPRFDTFPCKLSFTEEWTIPDWDNHGIEHEDGPETNDELRQDICGAKPNYWVPVHRLFGWPEQIQGDMQLECQLVSNGLNCGDGTAYQDPRAHALKEGAKDWRLLLQVDTDDENPGWMWGDVGRIYYWIHKDDLANRRFGKVRVILQCS